MSKVGLIRLVLIGCLSFFFAGVGHVEELSSYVQELTEKAEQGNADAQYDLAYMYLFGEGVLRDRKQAVKWYTKAAEQGNARAQWDLAVMYHFTDSKQAVKWYTKVAEQGNTMAQYKLAGRYRNGEGVLQDYKQAVKWYTKAAKKGHPNAQYELAVMYRNGEGVLQDYKQAVKWFTKAAEHVFANIAAQYELAVMYRNGEGVLQDYKQAVKWYTKAAKQGHAKAQRNLAFLYLLGDGVPKDHVEAYAWSIHAEMNGDLKLKDMLAKELTPDQITAGQVRAKELQKKTDRFKAQLPCSILYKGTKGLLFEHPLEDYFHAGNNRPDKLGRYFGFFEIKDSKLYLTKITKLHTQRKYRESKGPEWSAEWKEFSLSTVFPEAKGAVFAEWYSGRLTIPQGEVIEASPEYYLCLYEREIQIEVKNGIVEKTVVIDNTKEEDAAESDQ